MNHLQFTDEDWKMEQAEWLGAFEEVIDSYGTKPTADLFQQLKYLLARKGVANKGASINTPYINTIPVEEQPEYPGDIELESRIRNIIRWNAQAMVLQGGAKKLDLGGHIATYTAASEMIEVGMNHFFRNGELLLIQGHGSPGIYARAVMEGRLEEVRIANFRQELAGGVASYPHPRRMPDFWQIPSVSMGLGPMFAIYQARFQKYLEGRGLKPVDGKRIWCFIGDGEIDEPEILGCINLAARENLDNLTFIVNCNLQRLDGPVRGNSKIIQELERSFLGSGWETIKVIWGSDWDEIFAKDEKGVWIKCLEELVDGDYLEFSSTDGATVRKRIMETSVASEIAADLQNMSDDKLFSLIRNRGGQDVKKVYAAYHKAVNCGKPSVILMKTTKGFGMGKAAEGKNKAHQTKSLNDQQILYTAEGYDIPLKEEELLASKFYFPAQDSPEVKYMQEKRAALGGYIPTREENYTRFEMPAKDIFNSVYEGSEKAFSSTTAFVRILNILTKDKNLAKYIVPIVPDEAQTFGMEALFNSIQIYNPLGQQYQAQGIGMDVIKYKESTKGQVLQEGINEAGATSSFVAAGTAYSVHGVPMIPFYIYYSMFGFQRVGDHVWAAGDMLAKGFLIGGTAGRTTLNGEGLQHEDGHSLLISHTVSSIISYDPSFGYELAVIIYEGIRRMYIENEHLIYYITAYNENHTMPKMPEGVEEGILKGMYRFQKSANKAKKGVKAHLMGSGSIMQQVLKAAELLEAEGVSTDIWSVTSYGELNRDVIAVERENRLNPTAPEKKPYVTQLTENEEGVFVAASDYMKTLPLTLTRWMPKNYEVLGTDGYGLSESRAALRDYFEVDYIYIAQAALSRLAKMGKISAEKLADFSQKYNINPEKLYPMNV
jgi:pyruvate dehydrogenase E1 component